MTPNLFNLKSKLIIAVLCFLGVFISALPAWAERPCKDQLWKQYHSELWNGPTAGPENVSPVKQLYRAQSHEPCDF